MEESCDSAPFQHEVRKENVIVLLYLFAGAVEARNLADVPAKEPRLSSVPLTETVLPHLPFAFRLRLCNSQNDVVEVVFFFFSFCRCPATHSVSSCLFASTLNM